MKNMDRINYCSKCGAKLNVPGGVCLKCRNKAKTTNKKIPILSGFLSFLFPGLGQLYNNQIKKAIALIIIYLLLSFIFTFKLAVLTLLIRILSIIDAYITSNYINDAKFTEDTFNDFFKFIR